ncbi:hypothetical protein [Nesterenkonia sp. AN1]|uniref:hypothetical protein n=1 Tax=Nesterenkonia sp. AN1 TaxID=652017 RepID=UPI0013766AA6|nr:hypothetical protein [Nesterenkonia sp. AN1]
MLDARTVQLGAGAQAVRIIGPAQQTLKRLGEARTAGGIVEAAAAPGTAEQGLRVRARRQLAAVLIDGLPRPGALLAEQLARLPLGLLLLRDDHPVDREDVADGYPAAAVGQTRAGAVRRSCLRQNPEMTVITCSVLPPQPPATPEAAAPGLPQEPVDIHVTLRSARRPTRRDSAPPPPGRLVLPVVRHLEQWQIGPLLSRERGPCPQCLELHGHRIRPTSGRRRRPRSQKRPRSRNGAASSRRTSVSPGMRHPRRNPLRRWWRACWRARSNSSSMGSSCRRPRRARSGSAPRPGGSAWSR